MSRRQRPKTITELATHRAADAEPSATATGSADPSLSDSESASESQAESEELELDPLYGVALLKVALELKRRREGSPEDILRAVLLRMRLSEVEFRAWLAQRGELAKVFGET